MATGRAQAEIDAAFDRLAAIVDRGAGSKEVGYRHVSRVPGAGRFVIFSDHHMAFAGSRQDFFHSSGNADLYADILAGYAESGYTLVENGDVEELVIHEPSLPAPLSPPVLRADWRLIQLGQVIANHRSLYDQINEQFVEQGRYVRIAGNHDQDLQDPRFLDKLRSVYPKLEQVYDFLILEPTTDSTRYVIGHGHHFDKASTPNTRSRSARCSPSASPGPTRAPTACGAGTAATTCSTGPAATRRTRTPWSRTIPTPAPVHDRRRGRPVHVAGLPGPDQPVGGPRRPGRRYSRSSPASPPRKEPVGGPLRRQHRLGLLPEPEHAAEAVFNEVFCGKRWFKMRHLDEVFINDRLEDLFRKSVPYLPSSAHSHEPRHEAWDPAKEGAGRALSQQRLRPPLRQPPLGRRDHRRRRAGDRVAPPGRPGLGRGRPSGASTGRGATASRRPGRTSRSPRSSSRRRSAARGCSRSWA